jgi:hypothetical protein
MSDHGLPQNQVDSLNINIAQMFAITEEQSMPKQKAFQLIQDICAECFANLLP